MGQWLYQPGSRQNSNLLPHFTYEYGFYFSFSCLQNGTKRRATLRHSGAEGPMTTWGRMHPGVRLVPLVGRLAAAPARWLPRPSGRAHAALLRGAHDAHALRGALPLSPLSNSPQSKTRIKMILLDAGQFVGFHDHTSSYVRRKSRQPVAEPVWNIYIYNI